jgi:xylulokinase
MYIGIDIGTSEVKSLLLNDRQEIVATAGARLALSCPGKGMSEQDPDDWWGGTLATLQELRRQAPMEFAAARAIGLSGQMHGAVLLDNADRPLRPAMLWNDTRSAQECCDLLHKLPALPQVAGSLPMPGFTAPKLLWVKRHEPEVFSRISKVLLPKDYVRLKLTGEHVTDMSDASGTLWLDVAERRWSPQLIDLIGLDVGAMPRLVEGVEAGGALLPKVAAALGLRAGIPVAGGAGDNAASAVGMGCTEAGSGFVSLGTSGVVFVVTPSFQPNAESATHAFCHALPRRWHQMAVMLTAASALEWAARLVGAVSPAALEALASGLPAQARVAAPIFLPYLSGERTPHNDAGVRASLHGMDHKTDAASLGYAVIEGIAFGLADGISALRAAGSEPCRLSLVGGGSRSSTWAQLIASVLDVEILSHGSSTVGAALGAARLGWMSAGGDQAAVCVSPAVVRSFQPDPDEQNLLATRLARFRALYQPTHETETLH